MARGRRRPGSRWRSRDWLLAQALAEYERLVCPGCGNPLHETMDPALEDEWESPLPMRCHACTVIDARATAYAEASAPRALRFSAHRRGLTTHHDQTAQHEKEAWYAEQ